MRNRKTLRVEIAQSLASCIVVCTINAGRSNFPDLHRPNLYAKCGLGKLCSMAADFQAVFAVLKPVLGKFAKRLAVKVDTPTEYTLVTKSASPFPQHKGQPMYFGSVRLCRAYVRFHL